MDTTENKVDFLKYIVCFETRKRPTVLYQVVYLSHFFNIYFNNLFIYKNFTATYFKTTHCITNHKLLSIIVCVFTLSSNLWLNYNCSHIKLDQWRSWCLSCVFSPPVRKWHKLIQNKPRTLCYQHTMTEGAWPKDSGRVHTYEVTSCDSWRWR